MAMPERDPSASVLTPAGNPTVSNGQGGEAPPFPVPDHVLIRRIGKGAYGEVWLARNALGAWRAVKFVQRGAFADDRPFEREFDGIRRFEPISRSHESQLNILHVGRAEEGFYYVMELAEDSEHGLQIDEASYTPRNLRSELRNRGRLPVAECLGIGVALTTALEHLHKHGLVHRDIKPSNIVFVGGKPKLADIGLVTGIDEAKSFVGTEGYIPPEGPGTAQADLYSLGKVLYEIATGKDRQEFPQLPDEFRDTAEGEAFADLNEILLRACASASARRYATAEQMRAELLLLESGRSIRGLRANERLIRRLKLSGVVGTTSLVIIAAVALFQHQRAVDRTEQVRALTVKEEQRRQTAYAADMAIAFQNWDAGRADLTRELLEHQRPPRGSTNDLRGWEWRYLWSLWQQSRKQELRHMSVTSSYGLWSCAFSPEGQIVAGGAVDGPVSLWNPHTGQFIAQLGQPYRIDPVDNVAFGRDGLLYQSLRFRGIVIVWDWAGHQELFRFGTTNKGFRFTLSRDETLVATTDGPDYTPTGPSELVLWNARNGREVARAPTQTAWLIRAAFSPDGGQLATCGGRGHVKVWSVPELHEIVALPHDEQSTLFALAFSPDGRRLVTAATDGFLRIWEWESQRLLATWFGHSFGCDAVQWSPDGQLLATAGRDQIVRLWNPNPTNLMELAAFKGHAGRISGLAFSPNGRQLISASEDKSLRVWDVAAVPRTKSPRHWHADTFDPELALSPDSRWLALSIDTNTVQLLSPSSLETAAKVVGDRPVFSPDNRWLVTVVSNGLQMFSVPEGRRQRFFEADDSLVGIPAFAPGGTQLAMGTVEGSILLWDLTNAAPARRLAATNRLEGLFFTREGREVVSLHEADGTLEWFDTATGNCTRVLETGKGSVTCAALSPDGKSVLIGETAARMRLVDLGTGHWDLLAGDAGSVVSVAWSPDGQTMAAGTFEGFIKLWNTRTRREMAALHGHISMVTGLEFSRDGRHLVSGSYDSTWRVWSAPAMEETPAAPPELEVVGR
jgi:WD40 repeat protein/serine/threonine protein kinase